MRILVVDDDPAVRRSLEHALRRDGYDMASAADGASALTEHGAFRPDAVVLDVLMPEPNGLEVCRTLRSGGHDTPILMLTARDLVADRVAGLDAGPADSSRRCAAWGTSCAKSHEPAHPAGRGRWIRGGRRSGPRVAGPVSVGGSQPAWPARRLAGRGGWSGTGRGRGYQGEAQRDGRGARLSGNPNG